MKEKDRPPYTHPASYVHYFTVSSPTDIQTSYVDPAKKHIKVHNRRCLRENHGAKNVVKILRVFKIGKNKEKFKLNSE